MKKEVQMGIYAIRCLVNDKRYIGSAVDLYHRRHHHYSQLRRNKKENPHLRNAWNKYGENNFVFEILEIVVDINILVKREQYYIDLYKSNNPKYGYNIRGDAASNIGLVPHNKGKHHSDATKKKISKSAKMRTGEKNPMYGKNHSKESKEKMSISKKGKPVSQETRDKMSVFRTGKPLRLETRDKISASNAGVKRKKTTTSKYIGVSLSNGKYWLSRIRIDRKEMRVGSFKTEIEAALAYNEIAQYYFGWKAKLNVIPQEEIDRIWEIETEEEIKYREKTEKELVTLTTKKDNSMKQGMRDKISATKTGIKNKKNATSKYVGVTLSKDKCWKASIRVRRIGIHLGYFKTEIEAALAYNEAATEFWGWKAHLNYISQEEIDKMWEMEL